MENRTVLFWFGSQHPLRLILQNRTCIVKRKKATYMAIAWSSGRTAEECFNSNVCELIQPKSVSRSHLPIFVTKPAFSARLQGNNTGSASEDVLSAIPRQPVMVSDSLWTPEFSGTFPAPPLVSSVSTDHPFPNDPWDFGMMVQDKEQKSGRWRGTLSRCKGLCRSVIASMVTSLKGRTPPRIPCIITSGFSLFSLSHQWATTSIDKMLVC